MMQTALLETDRLPPIHSLMTLELNASFEPMGTWPLIPIHDALTKLYKGTADTVDTWKDTSGFERVFRSSSFEVLAPKVIVLKKYVAYSHEAKFSRQGILLRDRYCCQYCGKRFTSNHLTFDHLIPRTAGGKTTWENILMACGPCNSKKADKMPNFSGKKGKHGNGLRPLKMPHRPTNQELRRAALDLLPDKIKETWADWLYWTVELLEE